jgi:hypothetical protein
MMADSGLASPGICRRWLPDRLPGISFSFANVRIAERKYGFLQADVHALYARWASPGSGAMSVTIGK